MSDDSLLKGVLGQLGSLAKQTGKTFVSESGKISKTVVRQVISKPTTPESAEREKTKEAPQISSAQQVKDIRQQQNEDIVKAMYAPSEQNQTKKKTQAEQLAKKLAQDYPEKTPEEIQKMVQLQQQLHKETYYDPTFSPPKKEEPRAAEKVEQEKQQKMVELEKKEEEKPKPLAIDQAQNIEKFRGAAG